MSRIRLVINADDLGFHPRIDEGIFKAHQAGIVTSASLLCTGPSAREAVQRAQAQGLPLGLHLCLTSRFPPAAGPRSSLAPDGFFPERWPTVVAQWAARRLSLGDIDRELSAQLAHARALGARLDHLDGHQHLHLLPGIQQVVEGLARRERLPLRWSSEPTRAAWLGNPAAALKVIVLRLASRRPAVPYLRGLGVFEAGRLSEKRLVELLRHLPEGDWEIGCHPGLHPGQVPQEPRWRYTWEEEVAALCSPRARRIIDERGIQLTHYGELFGV